MSLLEASAALDLPYSAVENLVAVGHLKGYGFEEDARPPRKYFERADVLALQSRWRAGMPLADAAHYLGLSAEITVGLVEVGLLRATHRPDIDGQEPWAFLPADVDNCRERILEGVQWHRDRLHPLDLAATVETLRVLGFGAAEVLREAAEQRLEAHRRYGEANLANLMFKPGDVEAYIASYQTGSQWVTRKYVAEKMRVKFTVVSQWVAQGLAQACAGELGTWHVSISPAG
jgi:hypothetical protein